MSFFLPLIHVRTNRRPHWSRLISGQNSEDWLPLEVFQRKVNKEDIWEREHRQVQNRSSKDKKALSECHVLKNKGRDKKML